MADGLNKNLNNANKSAKDLNQCLAKALLAEKRDQISQEEDEEKVEEETFLQ